MAQGPCRDHPPWSGPAPALSGPAPHSCPVGLAMIKLFFVFLFLTLKNDACHLSCHHVPYFYITVQDFRKGTHGPRQCLERPVHPAPILNDGPSGLGLAGPVQLLNWKGFQQPKSRPAGTLPLFQTPPPLCRNLAWAGAATLPDLCPQPRKGEQVAWSRKFPAPHRPHCASGPLQEMF